MDPKRRKPDESTVLMTRDGSFLGMSETDILRLEAALRAEGRRAIPPPPAPRPRPDEP